MGSDIEVRMNHFRCTDFIKSFKKQLPHQVHYNSRAELASCLRVITWNRRFLQLFGIWPLNVYEPVFLFAFIYLLIHCVLSVTFITTYRGELDVIITNISETMGISCVLIKITLCRLHKDSLAEFLREIEDDFTTKKYRNRREIVSFIKYNRFALLFIAITVPCTGAATITYYSRSMIANVQMVIANSSVGYQLPYKVRPIVQIDDVTTYIFYCIYQSLIMPFLTFGYAAYDGFFVTLSLHVTGQLSILNRRVKDVLKDTSNCRHEIKKIIIAHERLIRLADTLEENFNIGILQQLLQTMYNICMTGYNALVGSSDGDNAKLFIFAAFSIYVLCTLFVYCYIGECFIQESTKLGEAFYDSEWYNISPTDLKLVLICMARSSKPLKLTSGKFVALSLYTFTDIIKTSVGYFSVMRSFL